VVEDIRAAADVLRPIHDRTLGLDGYASVEVAPGLAHDTQGTIEEARKLFDLIGRPNVMVKVPATEAGLPAIRQLTAEGLNVNITLIFAVEYYEQVIDAYLGGLEALAAADKPLDRVASVASFFVSRVDAEVDRRLAGLIAAAPDEARRMELAALQGKAAIANARIAYERFQQAFSGARFRALSSHGARPQRPLWASTGVKNPAYRDVLYVEQLIGPLTVNTMPPATLEAFQDHGCVERTVDQDFDQAHQTIRELEAAGVSMKDVTDKLQVEGIAAFADSFDRLAAVIQRKREALLVGPDHVRSRSESCRPAGVASTLHR
jgi:transaldolase